LHGGGCYSCTELAGKFGEGPTQLDPGRSTANRHDGRENCLLDRVRLGFRLFGREKDVMADAQGAGRHLVEQG